MLDERHSHRESENHKYPNLRGKRILVVEDDLIVAIDYHFQLKDVGATAGGFKATNEAALHYLSTHEVDAAIVDFQLCDGSGEPIIDGLWNRGIPFIVVSGCTFRMHGHQIAPLVLSKPVTPEEVCHALSEVLHRKKGDLAREPKGIFRMQ